uniref:MHC class I-like antigen recognition-like domain-containing protein n=1 Tax=Esox lucius TaxID=8010 RepID=A0A3P8X6V3_ESOLU
HTLLMPYVDGISVSLSGVHVFQWMYGCDWDDETGVIQGFDQYGYDGENLISLDLKTLSWIAPKPQAFITKNKWDSDKADNEYLKNYFTLECIEWLKKYLEYEETKNINLLHRANPNIILSHLINYSVHLLLFRGRILHRAL